MRKYKGIRAASFDTHCLSYGNSGGRLESFKVVIEYDPMRRLMPCLELTLKKESKRS